MTGLLKMIQERKSDHLRICVEKDVEAGNPGFDKIRLVHDALPEVDFDEIDLSIKFLGKPLKIPFIIEAITGGNKEAKSINKGIAKAAQELGVGFGVGSQRAAIEDASLAETYQVRDVAPDAFIIANLGAVQLNCGYGLEECRKAVEMIGADALALHINPLQEAVQPEGDKNFAGLAEKINEIAKGLHVPVIAKCVGSGMSYESAKKLHVAAIDVGGAGGTSWALVEGCRGDEKLHNLGKLFAGWGVPTAECIMQITSAKLQCSFGTPNHKRFCNGRNDKRIPAGFGIPKSLGDFVDVPYSQSEYADKVIRLKLKIPVIASGGVRSGLDGAKSIALGADCFGMALPVLRAFFARGEDGVKEIIEKTALELKTAMFLTGSKNVKGLRGKYTAV